MNSLENFLELPDVTDVVEEVFVSKRLGTFKVRAMSVNDHNQYLKRSRGKINKDGTDFDSGKFNLLIVAGQTVSPDFNNAELLKKANCATAAELINKKLFAGEVSELAGQICKISGFDADINNDIEEAKN